VHPAINITDMTTRKRIKIVLFFIVTPQLAVLDSWGRSDNSFDSFQFLEIDGINRENKPNSYHEIVKKMVRGFCYPR
jgi:hypothetical protein